MPSLLDVAKSLLGMSAYAPPVNGNALTLDSPQVKKARKQRGGNIQPLPTTALRLYHADIETAIHAANQGDMAPAARICRAMKQDGVYSGLLAQRTSGLIRLPKRFYGDPELVKEIESSGGIRSVFDMMFPPSELAALAADGLTLGIGVGELVPVVGRDFPVLVRLDPEYLQYRENEGQWYYRSTSGLIAITPGDGRWILHVPGPRQAPWQHGIWMSCAQAYVTKTHARLHRGNYGAKLANPARVAKAPAGSTEAHRAGFLRQVIAWGINSVFELPPGWDVALLESKGEGYQVWKDEIEDSNQEFMIAIAGQIVTTTGGSGFLNEDIFKNIRADLIQDTGDSLAYTLNTQGIPQFVAARHGIEAINKSPATAWDTKPPKDQTAEANSLVQASAAIERLKAVLSEQGIALDVQSLIDRFGIPTDPTRKAMPSFDAIKEATELAKAAGLKPTADTIRLVIEALGIELEDMPAATSNDGVLPSQDAA